MYVCTYVYCVMTSDENQLECCHRLYFQSNVVIWISCIAIVTLSPLNINSDHVAEVSLNLFIIRR